MLKSLTQVIVHKNPGYVTDIFTFLGSSSGVIMYNICIIITSDTVMVVIITTQTTNEEFLRQH